MGPDDATTSLTGAAMSTATQAAPGNITKIEHLNSSITKMKESLDDTNWVVWRELIHRIFAICNVEPYVYGQLKCPDPAVDRQMEEAWHTNDIYAQILIVSNCKVRAKGTAGKRAEPWKSGSSAPSEHCGSCWDKRNGRAWLQHGCCTPMDCRSPISGGRTQE